MEPKYRYHCVFDLAAGQYAEYYIGSASNHEEITRLLKTVLDLPRNEVGHIMDGYKQSLCDLIRAICHDDDYKDVINDSGFAYIHTFEYVTFNYHKIFVTYGDKCDTAISAVFTISDLYKSTDQTWS